MHIGCYKGERSKGRLKELVPLRQTQLATKRMGYTISDLFGLHTVDNGVQ